MSTISEILLCPITGEIMIDPVIDKEGNSYERAAIIKWLTTNQTSPITRSRLVVSDLVPNRILKNLIQEYHDKTASAAIVVVTERIFPEFGELDVDMDLEPILKKPGFSNIHLSIKYENRVRVPSDIVLVIDISSSMNDQANVSKTEMTGLSILDLVKHAVRTIKEVMNEFDRLSIVTFADNAAVILPLTRMTAIGKRDVERTLSTLVASGTTNLWDGLKTGMDVLPQDTICNNSFVVVLTDGVPSMEPPRGIVPMLKKYKEKNGLRGTLCTIGIGYTLDSKLLKEIATIGGGMYSFVPDGGFVGTVVINMISNILSTLIRDVTIRFNVTNDADKNSVVVMKKDIQSDQPFYFTLEVDCRHIYDIDIEFYVCGEGQPRKIVYENIEFSAMFTLHPMKKLSFLAEALKTATIKAINTIGSASAGQAIIREIRIDLHGFLNEEERQQHFHYNEMGRYIQQSLQGLLEDIEGQVNIGCESDETFNRWGKHYLRSLCRAHELRQSNNFKDPGIQIYGGPLFCLIRDMADEVFNNLTPPKPCRVVSSASASLPPRPQMQIFNNRSGGCFHENCTIQLANGSFEKARNVIRGMKLHDGNTIVAVMKTICFGGIIDLVHFPTGLMVTPFHPVKINGDWKFPRDLFDTKPTACDAIYSFLVVDRFGKYASSINVSLTDCITLCHGIENDPVASHDFFGTTKVVDHLLLSKGWYNSDGVVTPYGMIRDPITDCVCGLVIIDKHQIAYF
jgi:uncharacterized protein YegL